MYIAVGGEKAIAEQELHAQVPSAASEEAVVRHEDVLHEIRVGREEERRAHDVDSGEVAIVAGDPAHEAEAVGVEPKEELARIAAARAGGAPRRWCGR